MKKLKCLIAALSVFIVFSLSFSNPVFIYAQQNNFLFSETNNNDASAVIKITTTVDDASTASAPQNASGDTSSNTGSSSGFARKGSNGSSASGQTEASTQQSVNSDSNYAYSQSVQQNGGTPRYTYRPLPDVDTSTVNKNPTPVVNTRNITYLQNPDAQHAIVSAAFDGSIYNSTANDCAGWVLKVFNRAGYGIPYLSGADWCKKYRDYVHTTSFDIPIGAIVIGTGKNSNTIMSDYYYGHVGICVGDIDGDGIIDIRDCVGAGPEGVRTSNIQSWVSWQTDYQFGSDYHAPGFVGWIYPF